MKRRALFIFVILASLLSINLVFALPVLEINKQNFQPGETMFGKITGNFEESVTKSNIHFFIGGREVFPEFDITFYNKAYYFYAYLKTEGNYSFNINNILYRDTELNSINLNKELFVQQKEIVTQIESNESGNITYTNKTDKQLLSIQPGFVFTTTNAEVFVTNLGTQALNISYKFEDVSENFSLLAEESRKITLNPTKEFSYLELNSFESVSIPVIYTPLNTPIISQIKPSEYSLTIESKTSNITEKVIQLFNFGDANITKIKISHNLSVLETEKEIKQLNARGVYNLTLKFYSENSGIFSDSLIINYSSGLLEIPIEVIFSTTGNISVDRLKSCSDLKGTICVSGESCNGTASFVSDGYCCAGNCYVLPTIVKKSEGSYNWLIGIIIFLIVGLGGFFLYKKYKKVSSPKPQEKLEKTAKLYEKRVSGNLTKE